MSTRVEVKGLAELKRRLNALPTAVEKRIVRSALRSALSKALAAIRGATYTTVSKRTGLLRSGLKVKSIKRPIPATLFASGVYAAKAPVGFVRKAMATNSLRKRKLKATKKNPKGGYSQVTVPYYWRMLEFGTKRMSAKPYIGRAFSSVAGEMMSVFRQRIEAGIEREMRRQQ